MEKNAMASFNQPTSYKRMACYKVTQSPIMFNMITHDVVQKVPTEDVKMHLYVDDMLILSNNRTSLQEAINRLEEWSQENDMYINQNKTKIMKFRKGGKLSSTDIFICGNRTLKIIKSFKYLGVTLSLLDSKGRNGDPQSQVPLTQNLNITVQAKSRRSGIVLNWNDMAVPELQKP